MNRPVDVRFDSKVDHGARLVLREELFYQSTISNIAADENVARVAGQRLMVLQVSRVGQLVEVDDAVFLGGNPIEDEVGADKSGSAGDKDGVLNIGESGLATDEGRFRRITSSAVWPQPQDGVCPSLARVSAGRSQMLLKTGGRSRAVALRLRSSTRRYASSAKSSAAGASALSTNARLAAKRA